MKLLKNILLLAFVIILSSCVRHRFLTKQTDKTCFHPIDRSKLVDWKKNQTITFQIDSIVYFGTLMNGTLPKTSVLKEGVTHVKLNDQFGVTFNRIPVIEYARKINLLEFEITLYSKDTAVSIYQSGLERLSMDCQNSECHKRTQSIEITNRDSQKIYLRTILEIHE